MARYRQPRCYRKPFTHNSTSSVKQINAPAFTNALTLAIGHDLTFNLASVSCYVNCSTRFAHRALNHHGALTESTQPTRGLIFWQACMGLMDK